MSDQQHIASNQYAGAVIKLSAMKFKDGFFVRQLACLWQKLRVCAQLKKNWRPIMLITAEIWSNMQL